MEIYDSYQGEKAKELEKRVKAALDEIELGQELDQNLREKLTERDELVRSHKRHKTEEMRKINQTSDQRKFVAYEILENKSYNNLKKIIDQEEYDMKKAKNKRIEEKKLKDKLIEQHMVVVEKVKQHKIVSKGDHRDKSE